MSPSVYVQVGAVMQRQGLPELHFPDNCGNSLMSSTSPLFSWRPLSNAPLSKKEHPRGAFSSFPTFACVEGIPKINAAFSQVAFPLMYPLPSDPVPPLQYFASTNDTEI